MTVCIQPWFPSPLLLNYSCTAHWMVHKAWPIITTINVGTGGQLEDVFEDVLEDIVRRLLTMST